LVDVEVMSCFITAKQNLWRTLSDLYDVLPLNRAELLLLQVDAVNRPGMSGDFEPWEGWSHARRYQQAVPA
ncbi:MAG: hypothetical protein WBA72_10190, partial [Ornithinimicrobium sp.]